MIGVPDSLSAVPAECEVLLRAARRSTDAESFARLEALIAGPFDWKRCRDLATRHGMTPLLVRALSRCSAQACSSEIWNQLLDDTRAIAVANLSATAELIAIVEDLNAADISALALKGPVAGLALYGDVASRPFLDLDLLIAREDIDRTSDCLAARGYRPELDLDAAGWRHYFRRYFEMVCIHSRTGVQVDLHWALLDPRYRFSAVLAGWQERAVSLSIGTRQVQILCPEDMLLYSLLHAAKHEWKALRSLVDAALLIEARDDIDWAAVALAVAKAPGCRRVMAVGFRLVEMLFGSSVKGTAANWIVRDAHADELVNEAFGFLTRRDVLAQLGPPWPWRQRFYRSMCRRDRLRYAYDTMVAPTSLEWLATPLPEWLAWLYPAVRIARLTEKHVWRSLMRPVKHTQGDSTRQRSLSA